MLVDPKELGSVFGKQLYELPLYRCVYNARSQRTKELNEASLSLDKSRGIPVFLINLVLCLEVCD